jgi:signal transduction histidine kinase/CheY-like chemotaxis protein
VRSDDGYRWVHAVARATVLPDHSILWHGLLLDADARRGQEEELKRFEATMRNSQRLESLGVLAGGIAHEFNNQLQTVLGNVGYALDELGPDSSVAEALLSARDAGMSAAGLCRRLLDYTGQAPPITGAVEVNELVREMARLFQVSVPRDAVLALDLAPERLHVEADTAQLRQVILNLVTNAAEALHDVGPRRLLTVRTQPLSGDVGAAGFLPGPLPAGDWVAIEVDDTGSGFDGDSLARAFDPFFTTREPGRGMGLAATLGILRSHGGGIRIEPAEPRGTHVRVLLPARAAPVEAALEDASPAEPHGRRVLVVDDEPSVRRVCERILGAVGFEVVTVDSGAAAIAAVRRSRERGDADERSGLDVAIIDLTMPRLDGHGTLEELRRLVPDLPVVLISGYDSSRLAGRALDRITSFLPKPFLPEELVRAVRAALAAKRDR